MASTEKKESSSSSTTPGTSADALLFHCDNCKKDITGKKRLLFLLCSVTNTHFLIVIRIKCAVCKDFDLCIECFTVGVEIHPHRNDHAYQVMDDMHFALFSPDWGADEELLLLEGIEMFGLGNWTEVVL